MFESSRCGRSVQSTHRSDVPQTIIETAHEFGGSLNQSACCANPGDCESGVVAILEPGPGGRFRMPSRDSTADRQFRVANAPSILMAGDEPLRHDVGRADLAAVTGEDASMQHDTALGSA